MACTFPFPPTDSSLGDAVVEQCSSGLMLVVEPAMSCTTTEIQTVTSEQCQPIDGEFTETVTVSGAPSTVQVQQLVGGTVIFDQTVSPTYQINEPNGPSGGPICHQAAATWTIP